MNIFLCVSHEKRSTFGSPRHWRGCLFMRKVVMVSVSYKSSLWLNYIYVCLYICMSRPGKSCFTDLFAQELIPWGLSLPATCIIILIDRKSKGEIPIPRALCTSATPPDQPERGRHQHPHQDQSPWSNPSLQALQVARGRQRSVRLTSWARRSSGLPFTQRQSHQS